MELAYVAATIPLMKKVPKLQSLLVPVGEGRRQQTADEAKAVMRQIFASRKSKRKPDGIE
jgi:hypothetical protein